jgi:adenylylsulfate kinase
MDSPIWGMMMSVGMISFHEPYRSKAGRTQPIIIAVRGVLLDRGAVTESLLIITGTMGAGKSAVLAEASDILAQRGIVHAAVDLDALGLAYLADGRTSDQVMYRNLASVCENYKAAGVKRVLLARAIESRLELEVCLRAVSAAEVSICRLGASLETMEGRVGRRELGVGRQEYVGRVKKLDLILDGAKLEDLTISNEDRAVTDVASEMLLKAGWI